MSKCELEAPKSQSQQQLLYRALLIALCFVTNVNGPQRVTWLSPLSKQTRILPSCIKWAHAECSTLHIELPTAIQRHTCSSDKGIPVNTINESCVMHLMGTRSAARVGLTCVTSRYAALSMTACGVLSVLMLTSGCSSFMRA